MLVPSKASTISFMPLVVQLIDDTNKVHWFLCGLGAISPVSPLTRLHSLTCPYLLILFPKLKVLRFFRGPLSLQHLLLLPSQPFPACPTAQTSGILPALTLANPPAMAALTSLLVVFLAVKSIDRDEGHYADQSPQRYNRGDSAAHLAEAFTGSCSLNDPPTSDWFLDTRA